MDLGNRWMCVIAVAMFLLCAGFVGVSVEAQDETTDAQVTIAALQTQLAGIQTQVAVLATQAAVDSESDSVVPPQTPIGDSATVIYEADWTGGTEGWTSSPDWAAVAGMLVSNGDNDDGDQNLASYSVYAPFDTTSIGDYAVEAEIQLARYADSSCGDAGFGVVVREKSGEAYWVGVVYDRTGMVSYEAVRIMPEPITCNLLVIAEENFEPEGQWHLYRVEVEGNQIRLFIDDILYRQTTDNTHLTGDQVGVWSDGAQISVRSFKVTAL